MRVLVGCEFSGIVRDAFAAHGWDAWSCDLLPTEAEAHRHYRGDILDFLDNEWDLIVLHPPCTALTASGNRWYANSEEREEAIRWTVDLFNKACELAPHVALENPVGVLTSHMPVKPFYIQPWMFGHDETKKTGFWCKDLPPLEATHDKPEVIEERIWRMAPSPNRWKERSRFLPMIAEAMATQWTPYIKCCRNTDIRNAV